MLVAQAELQFASWTGIAAPQGVMARAARAFVEEMTQ
jgi:shikimate 5-dehydrogenase